MILSGESLSDGGLHESGKRWQDVDGRIDLLVVELSVNENLSLSDISGKIWNWVSDIIVGHGQDWDLSNGSVLSSDSTGSLVDGGEIGIEVTWVRSSSWDFFSGSGNFSEGVGVGGHISQDDQDVQLSFVGQILSSSQSKTWGNNSLNGWILG